METMKQSRPWSSLGTHGSQVVIWWLYISSSGENRKFDFLSQILPWRSKSIAPQNNRDLNQGILHLWSKFGDPSLNGWWVIERTNLVTDGETDGRTGGRTDAGNDNTRRPKLASGKNANCEHIWGSEYRFVIFILTWWDWCLVVTRQMDGQYGYQMIICNTV